MSFDLDVATRTLWMEARGEPEEAQKAVASVLVNRVHDGRWGKTLASVCLWPYQFSSWNTTDVNRKVMSTLHDNDLLLQKLSSFIGLSDITNGATHYYSIDIPEPNWVPGSVFCGQFGKQKFYKGVK